MDSASCVKRRSELTSCKKPEKPPGVDDLASIWFVSALIIVLYDISVIAYYLDVMCYGSYLVIFILDFLFCLVWFSTCFGLWMDKSWSYSLAQFIVLMLIIRIFVGIVMSEFILAGLLDLVSIVSYGGLFNSLEDAKNSHHIRQVAAKALKEIGDSKAVDPLIRALKDGNQEIKEIAAEALGQIGDSKAVDPLIMALKDGNWAIRLFAARALGKIGGKRTAEPLIRALKDRNRFVRRAAAEALGQIGDSKAVDPLIRALKDGNHEIKEIAAEALGKIGNPRAVEPLIEVLGDRNWISRKTAIKALGEIGDERAVESLIETLRDRNWDVRRAAAEALGKTGNERATEPLVEARKDSQRDSCRYFGKIGYKRAIKPFIRTFKIRVRYIQRAARTLRKMALKIERPTTKRKRIPREIRKPQWPELEEAAEIPLFDID